MQNSTPSSKHPTGVLLVNLGTPASPSTRDIRRFLREFLSDPRVLTMAPAFRWALLNLIILPFRPKRIAPAYEQIWLEEGSPLLVHSRALREGVSQRLGDAFYVDLAMRYQQPDIHSALLRMQQAGVQKLVVLPLFPQYSESATGSAIARVEEEATRIGDPFELIIRYDFNDDPGFIRSQAETIQPILSNDTWDHVLFSYHGLPESQIRAVQGCLSTSDCCDVNYKPGNRCYRAQCFGTSRALAESLDLKPDSYSSSFQSRLTREPWIKPYTDFVLPDLYKEGVRRLLVACPAFTADNLETVEEIHLRLRDQWAELGGAAFGPAPCVHDSQTFIDAISQWAVAMAQTTAPDSGPPISAPSQLQ